MSSQWGSQKLLQELVSPELTAYLTIFNLFKRNELWTYSQKHVNQIILNRKTLKLSFMNIWGLHSNFIDCKSLLESNSPDILALCETNLDDSTDSGNFSVRGYLPLIWKDSSTYMHGLAVYVKERPSFCMRYMSRKLCRFLMFLTGFTSLFSVLLLFPLLITFFNFVHGFWFYFI